MFWYKLNGCYQPPLPPLSGGEERVLTTSAHPYEWGRGDVLTTSASPLRRWARDRVSTTSAPPLRRGAKGVCGVKSLNPTPQRNCKINKELYKLAIIEIKRIIKNL